MDKQSIRENENCKDCPYIENPTDERCNDCQTIVVGR